jgi:hypothetical protein
MLSRRAMANRVRASRTNSHAEDAVALGLRAQPKLAQPRLINLLLVQPLKALKRERHGPVRRHTEARRAGARATAVAAMNGRRRREDRQDITGARRTARHAARAHRVAMIDGREETATRQARDRSRGSTPSNRWSIAALRM